MAAALPLLVAMAAFTPESTLRARSYCRSSSVRRLAAVVWGRGTAKIDNAGAGLDSMTAREMKKASGHDVEGD